MSNIVSMMIPIDELSTVFEDLERVPQDDGLDPVCVIQYPTAFSLAYDYLRACWKTNEMSQRSLKLSATCLKLNPANYTVWHYRRQCLRALQQLLETESDPPADYVQVLQADLTFTATLGGGNPKNYQIWYHRRALLEEAVAVDETRVDPDKKKELLNSELQYIQQVLSQDSKNYHSWSHRQWVLQTLADESAWEQELEYVHQLIKEDPRNNSAWNQRWFVVHRGKIPQQPLTLEMCRKEADFAVEGARLDPYNESPYRYLHGLLREQKGYKNELFADYHTQLESLQTVLEEAQRKPEACASWISAKIDMLEGMGDKDSFKNAIVLARSLAEEHDVVRKKYWHLRIAQLQQRMSTSN